MAMPRQISLQMSTPLAGKLSFYLRCALYLLFFSQVFWGDTVDSFVRPKSQDDQEQGQELYMSQLGTHAMGGSGGSVLLPRNGTNFANLGL